MAKATGPPSAAPCVYGIAVGACRSCDPDEPQPVMRRQCPVVEETGRHRIGGLRIALDRATPETGNQIERTSQRGGRNPLTTMPLADVTTRDPPVRQRGPVSFMCSAILDPRHLIRLTPPHTVITLEHERSVSSPRKDAVQLAFALTAQARYIPNDVWARSVSTSETDRDQKLRSPEYLQFSAGHR